ncbi:hypothetical protein [Runella slithyformis]|uniref:hypothetical protein n=1 Tax=Runella slithyformis TaxID=106 RepID=UPI00059C0AAB|nr:hypothetical protein [Runella slithyformis]
MVVILTHHSDQTSNIIIDWLYAKNIEFYRVNIEDFLSTNNTFYLSKNGKKNISITLSYNKVVETLKNNDKIVFWFRKWSNPSVLEKHYKTDTLEHQVGEFIENEIEEYQKLFFADFKNSQWLNNLSVLDLKKFNLLLMGE